MDIQFLGTNQAGFSKIGSIYVQNGFFASPPAPGVWHLSGQEDRRGPVLKVTQRGMKKNQKHFQQNGAGDFYGGIYSH